MTAAVIGGGLTGCLAALDIADRGMPVVIFDCEPGLMQRASLANEGKVHLGYVYSADATFRTARTLIDDALLFRFHLEKWMTAAEFDACVTGTFHYIIPDDSKLPAEQILAHFQQVEAYTRDREHHRGLTYLGLPQESHHTVETRAHGLRVACRERAVWPPGIASALTCAIHNHPRIEVRARSSVLSVDPSNEKWCVNIADGAPSQDGPFDVVLNAAWAGRRNIDRASGFGSDEAWFTRFKFGVLLEHTSEVFNEGPPDNGTGTSGPFGDSVYYPQNDSLYCSWYPVGMCFTSQTDRTDFDVNRTDKADPRIRDTWRGYASIDPSYKVLASWDGPTSSRLIGDFIVAKGQTDIVDDKSRLHERYTHGPRELCRGYWSIDTGKYSSAPRCAAQCVDAIFGTA